jgi:calcium/calmodulin-dependent protein kinase I
MSFLLYATATDMAPRDVWAIGVITYFLLCGYTPFDRDSNLEEMQAILVADYSFTPLEYWRGVSLSARAFIKRCLTIDPTKRMTSHEALTHEWIAGPAQGRGKEDLLPNVKKNFNARRTLHKAIDTVRAINQLRAGGGMGIMDGAQSHRPERVDTAAATATKDKDGDVNMDAKNDNSRPSTTAV